MSTLFKTSLWTGTSTLIKAIATYVIWKVIALYTGPVGLAVIEQFQNFIQIARALSSSLYQGIVKYIAEYKNDETKKSQILSSGFTFNIIISFGVGIILFLFSAKISTEILKTVDYQNVIITLAASLLLYSLNNFLLAVLNGELEIKKYVSCNIANTILIFIITVYLVTVYGLYGGLVAFALNQSLILFFTLYLVFKCHWFKVHDFLNGVDKDSFYKLTKYALMTLISALIVPISLIIVRNYVASELSWEDAGYWQGIIKLSTGYLTLMNLVLSIYYLPRFSEIKLVSELKAELLHCYKFLLPLALLAAISIFILKKQIVVILFSKQFIPMLTLFKYQLIGDIARVGAWVLTNIMLARAMVKTLVATEIGFSISYVLLTVVFVHYMGLIGTAIAFTINYLVYWIWLSFFTVRYLRQQAKIA